MNDRERLVNFYLDQNLIIRPFHSVVDGKCSCKKDCGNPGKHPILTGNCYIETFKRYLEIEARYPNFNLSVATGFYSKINKSLVIIDVDDEKELDFARTLVPCLDNTLSVKTRKGYHFWFWAEGSEGDRNHVWINTVIGFEGHKLDILGEKRNALCPGSNDKSFHQFNEIMYLTEEQIKRIKTKQRVSLKKIKKDSENNKPQEAVDMFSGTVVRGQYHAALVQASCSKLRRDGIKVVDGSYTLQNHVEWLCTQAMKYLPRPVDLKKVEQVARSNFKTFDPNKTLSSEEHFDKMCLGLNSDSKNILEDILRNKFQDIKKKKFQRVESKGFSCSELKLLIQGLFVAGGGEGSLLLTDNSLMAAFRMFHKVDKTVKNSTVNGKRVTQMIWLLELVP